MKTLIFHASHSRLRIYLTAGYALFIVYASLSPFSGWQDQGLAFSDVLTAPLKQSSTLFDSITNLLAYLPFGLLLGLTLHTYVGAKWTVPLALAGGAALSAAMEYSQMYLPARFSSNMDLLSNSTGALIGALLAATIAPRRWFAFLTYWRGRLFRPGGSADFGLALVLLWVFAQVNPSLPMLGNVFISELAHQPFMTVQPAPFHWLEVFTVTLNLLMLGTLLLTLLRHRRDAMIVLVAVLFAVALMKFFAAATLLKSWALMLWVNSEAMLGLLIGLLLLSVALLLSQRAVLLLATTVALGHLAIGFFVLDKNDPDSTYALFYWHYGHLLNYSGLSQTIMLAFPFLLLGYLWRVRMR
ncbi:MAG: VanZ family protein [Gallionellaceae bacterium]|jgi:VanZ family protein|nr:VanZ family protein [Gallionellaceae bacterium]